MVVLTAQSDRSLIEGLKRRRVKLAQLIKHPVILWSGNFVGRNFPANKLPFRASSHFLYFTGISLDNAAIRLSAGELELFMDNPPPEATLWHGAAPSRDEIGAMIGADRTSPLAELANNTAGAATIAIQDLATYQQQCQLLNRPVALANRATNIDLELVQALVKLRSRHDDLALSLIHI
jgi:Xaa-Pro aminopeptidase